MSEMLMELLTRAPVSHINGGGKKVQLTYKLSIRAISCPIFCSTFSLCCVTYRIFLTVVALDSILIKVLVPLFIVSSYLLSYRLCSVAI
jgi:hypothetical protein